MQRVGLSHKQWGEAIHSARMGVHQHPTNNHGPRRTTPTTDRTNHATTPTRRHQLHPTPTRVPRAPRLVHPYADEASAIERGRREFAERRRKAGVAGLQNPYRPVPQGVPTSFALPGPSTEDNTPQPKRQAREGPGGDPSVDEVADDAPSCEPAGNYGIGDIGQSCYAAEDETLATKERKHQYDCKEFEWRNIGSGAWATILGTIRLPVTARGGPCSSDIHRRIVRDALTNQRIDDCYIDDTTGADIDKILPQPRDLRV